MPQANLITNKSNVQYLSGFTGSAGFMLLTKSSKYLFTDFRYIERAKNTIKACPRLRSGKGIKIINIAKMWKNPKNLKTRWQELLKKHRIKTLGIEESDLTVAGLKKFKKISRGASLKYKDISGKIESMREIKGPQELKLIQKSQRINEKVFLAIKKQLRSEAKQPKPKVREIDIVWRIKKLGYQFGADDISFDPIVAFGKNSAIPHHLPGKTKLKKGDIVLIDMGMKYKGYCSDMTRVIFTKKPTEKQQKIYEIVLKAQKAGLKSIKAGLTGKQADKLSRKIIEKAGYSEYYEHSGGHGIGLDVHEQPSLADNYTKKLKPDSVITIEPGIYLPNKFGVRIEDMIVVKKQNTKNLTKVSKKLA